MMNLADLASAPCDRLAPFTDQLRLAVAAYLARFKGSSRYHTESDLRCYLSWCSQHCVSRGRAIGATAGWRSKAWFVRGA
jgi:hypothetical protein